jgi:hypothetical protein
MEINLNDRENDELLEFLSKNFSFSGKREFYEHFLCKTSLEIETELLKSGDEIICRLIEDGISPPFELLTSSQVDEVVNFFKGQKCLPGHVADATKTKGEMGLDEAFSLSNFATYPMEQILNAPYLLKIGTSEEFLNRAKSYLGPSPVFYEMLLFWAKLGDKIAPTNQAFHRDEDDFKFLSLFVFLTDVDGDEDGPHGYLKGSHNSKKIEEYFNTVISKRNYSKIDKLFFGIIAYFKGIEQGYKYRHYGNSFFSTLSFSEFVNSHKLHPTYDKILSELAVKVFGKRGTGFYADPGGYHKGTMPKSKPRLIFSARFASSGGCASRFKSMAKINFESSGVNKDDLDQEVFRLLLQK